MDNKIFKIKLIINNYCNLDCKYCCENIPYLTDKNKNMDISQIRMLVLSVNSRLKDFNIHWVLCGGETLLHPQIEEITNILRTTNNLYKITFLTNGYAKIPEFNNYDKLYFVVSFHYDTLVEHDFNISFPIFKDNIYKLLNNNANGEIRLLSAKHTDKANTIIKKLLKEIPNTFIIINKPIIPTEHYDKDDFDSYYMPETPLVYPYRRIIIDLYFNWSYGCSIVDKDKDDKLFHSLSLLSKKDFDIIKSNINKTLVCNYKECKCPSCYPVSS